LIYREQFHIPLVTKNTILMVKTVPWNLNDEELQALSDRIEYREENNVDEFCILRNDCYVSSGEDNKSVLIINEANLTKVERERVDHWRNAHRSSDGSRYKERCHTCEQSKHKSVYKQNAFFNGTTISTNKPYWRLYADAYGGERSMGSESYQGGIGGFVFVCPVSGRIRAKLYSSQRPIPIGALSNIAGN
jgi:hypothetical protein